MHTCCDSEGAAKDRSCVATVDGGSWNTAARIAAGSWLVVDP
jgi:hypothetical protein